MSNPPSGSYLTKADAERAVCRWKRMLWRLHNLRHEPGIRRMPRHIKANALEAQRQFDV